MNEEEKDLEAEKEEKHAIDNAEFSDAFDEFANEQDGIEPDPEEKAATSADTSVEADPKEDKKAAEGEPGEDVKDTESTAKGADAIDPWADVPDTIKQEHEALKLKLGKSEQQYKSAEGRFKARERQAAKDHDTKLAAATAANPDSGQTADPLDAIREDYPELVEPFEKALAQKDSQILDVTNDVKDLKASNNNNALLQEQDRLTQAHPHWLESIRHPDFNDWVADQPHYVQDVIQQNEDGIVDSNSSLHVIRAFELSKGISYEQDADPKDSGAELETAPFQEKLSGKRSLQKKSVEAPDSKEVGAVTDGPADEFDAAFDHYAAKKDKINASL